MNPRPSFFSTAAVGRREQLDSTAYLESYVVVAQQQGEQYAGKATSAGQDVPLSARTTVCVVPTKTRLHATESGRVAGTAVVATSQYA